MLQPAATPAPTATATRRVPLRGTPTATVRPLAPALVAAKRLLPLVIKVWPPTSTFTPTATATRTLTPTSTRTPIKYGWRGIGQTDLADALGARRYPAPTPSFWGVKYDWWYNWQALTDSAATGDNPDALLTILAQGLASDPLYVPMIWCPNDADANYPAPAQAAVLAAQYPGRVWLLFNEPDNDDDRDGCGETIRRVPDYSGYYPAPQWVGTPWPFDPQPTATPWPTATPAPAGTRTATPRPAPTPDRLGYNQLGKYLALQYREYYCAIKQADPTARVFAPALMQLPMPNISYTPRSGVANDWQWYKRGLAIWDKFQLYLTDPNVVASCADGHRPALDGIVVHSYPNNFGTWHTGCQNNFADAECIKQALADAHPYFQATQVTQQKPIWITEIGSLTEEGTGYVDPPTNTIPRQTWQKTAEFMAIMLSWARGQFTDQAGSNQLTWYNAVGWFSMRSNKFSASDLINVTVTPVPGVPGSGLSPVGSQWNQETCNRCQCPGPDCP